MRRLTRQTIEAAKLPAAGQRFIRDDLIRGLALRVTANGAKSFVFEARIKGRMRRLTLGQFPAMSLTLAKEKALGMKSAIARGEDPALERARDRGEPTFKVIADRYIEQHSKPFKKSWRRDEQRISEHFSKWLNRRISDISPEDAVRVHQAIAEDRGPVEANRAIELLRTMMNTANKWGLWTGPNPAERVQRFKENARERFLSPDELRRLNVSLAEEPNIYWRAYFALSLILGARKNELLAARWSDIDLEQRTWLLPTTKAGRSHLLPLPEPAVGLLMELPSRGEGRAHFVFPGSGIAGHLVEPRHAWVRITARAGLQDIHIHDLRRTLGSWLAGQGHGLPLIGRALNHINPSSTAIYARLGLDPVRDALEKNAALMLNPPKSK